MTTTRCANLLLSSPTAIRTAIRTALHSLNPFCNFFLRNKSASPSAPFRPRPLNKFHYHKLMHAFSQSNDCDAVLHLLQRMKQTNCSPDVFCYTTVIDSLASSSRPWDAISMFHEMLDSGITPTVYCFNFLIRIYACQLNHFDSAFAVLNWMLDQGCEPNVVSYSTLIDGLCKAGRREDALNVFDDMLKRGCEPNQHTYAPILKAFCEEGRIWEMKLLMETMSSHGCQPDVVIYNILVHGLCKIGDFDEVERVINASKENGWEPDEITYSTYIVGLCYTGNTERALGQLDCMLQKGLKPTTIDLNILLEGLGRQMDISTSQNFLETCIELGFDVDITSYNTVMNQLSKMGRWVDVLSLFVNLFKKGVHPDGYTFSILIYSLCKAGEFGMVKSFCESKGFVPNMFICNILLREFYMSGEVRELASVLSNLDRCDIVSNMSLHGTIIDCLCRTGRIFEAVTFVRNFEDGYPTDLVSRLTFWLVRMGKIGDILMLIEEMLRKGLVLESQIFDQMIRAFCHKGFCGTTELSKVQFLLDRMFETGRV